MADDTKDIPKAIKKSPIGRWLWTVSTMLMLPLLAWLGNEALDEYRGFSKTIETLNDRLLILESNKTNNEAVWNAIAETNHKITDMRVNHEAGRKHLDWLSDNWVLLQLVKGAGTGESTVPNPVLPVPKKPPPIYTPVPKLDPKDFRLEYEHKFPNPAQQPKK